MTPCPERRILRKLLREDYVGAHLDASQRLHVDSTIELDPIEILVLTELLNEEL